LLKLAFCPPDVDAIFAISENIGKLPDVGFVNYSGDPNTGHLNSGYIQKPDKMPGFRMVSTSLHCFLQNNLL
jgi:hypothetical protein